MGRSAGTSMVDKFYDVHGIVRLQVAATAAIASELDHHLGSFAVDALRAAPDVVIEPYDAAPAISRTTVVDDYDHGDGSYHRRASRFWMNQLSAPQRYCMDRLHLPINLIVQLALLRTGHTFLHGAGVVLDGTAVLFPAYPGTGKTTLVTAFLKAGASMLGDDLCIVGKGDAYAYPQALSVYPHHLPVLGYNDRATRRAFARTAFIDRAVRPIESSQARVLKLARVILSSLRTPAVNLSPAVVFGSGAIGQSAKIRQVAALERSGDVQQLVMARADPGTLAAQATAVLWHEWHASFHDLLLYDALAESGRGIPGRFDLVRQLLHAEFLKVPCVRIRIPADWGNQTLVEAFPAFWRQRSAET